MLGERAGGELGGDLLACHRARVDYRNQLASCGLRVFLRVEAAEIPHADHGGSYFLHRNGIMPTAMSSPPQRHTSTPPLGPLVDLPTGRPLNPPPDDVEPSPRIPPRVRNELIVLGVLLLFGLIGMPLLTWMAGNRWLGPYTHEQNLHAGPLALLQDFYIGLLHGSAVFWVVALGPAALVVLVRLFIALVRALPSARRDR